MPLFHLGVGVKGSRATENDKVQMNCVHIPDLGGGGGQAELQEAGPCQRAESGQPCVSLRP